MEMFKGIGVSGGVVIGRVFVLEDASDRHVPKRAIGPDQVPAELERFAFARKKSIEELNKLHRAAEAEMGSEAAKIFLFHVGALSDKAILDPVRTLIEQDWLSAEYAVQHVIGQLAERFGQHPDSTFQTKVSDLQDLSDRLVGHLVGQRRTALLDLPEGTVIVSRDLTPSQAAAFNRDKVIAFVTDMGGRTSHTAIVARALNLPSVVGASHVADAASDGMQIVVDGDRGVVVLCPDAATLDRYRGERERAQAYALSLQDLADLPAVTADGVEIHLHGNIEFPTEVPGVLASGGTGVGLYRTEFLYLTSSHTPMEHEHYEAYRTCLELLQGRPLTIRTVDLGADKYTQAQAAVPERNPFLGLRSIRYCLQNTAMFKTQLRAILRASAHGPLRVMFPLVTTINEFRQGKYLVRDAMEDLADEGVAFDRDIPLGMMIEVPSAALMASTFAREADFFSIGTNDLVQYTLAVDRTNERVASLYNPAHPAVLRLLRDVVRAGRRYEIPVSCCGEAAAEPEFAALLIGLGLRTLSVSAPGIPALKRLIRSLTTTKCERIAKKAIGFDSEQEAAAYVRDRTRKLVPEAFGGRAVDEF